MLGGAWLSFSPSSRNFTKELWDEVELSKRALMQIRETRYKGISLFYIFDPHRTLLKHILLKYTSLKFSVSGYICHKELKCLIFPQKEGVDPRAILDQVFWRNSRMFFSLNPTRPRKQTINIESHKHPQMFQFTVFKRWRSDKYINFQFVAFLKNSFWKYVLTNIFSFGQIWPS